MKKIVSLLLVVLSLLCFASCGEQATPSEGLSAAASSPSFIDKEGQAYTTLVAFVHENGTEAPESPKEGTGSGYVLPSFDRCFVGEGSFNTGSSSIPVHIYVGVVGEKLCFAADSVNRQYVFTFEEDGSSLTITAKKKNAFDCEEFVMQGDWVTANEVFNKRHETSLAGVAFDKEPRYQTLWTMEKIEELLSNEDVASFADLGYRHVPSVGAAV